MELKKNIGIKPDGYYNFIIKKKKGREKLGKCNYVTVDLNN